jgi:hypothetical protein
MILVLSTLAFAGDNEHWWGVGPLVGTTGFPIEYPAVMPALAQDADGNNLVEPVRFDLRVGGHAVYYLGGGARIGTRLWYGGNFDTWSAQEITAEYELILTKEDKFQVLAGGGLGYGHDRFGASADAKKPDAYLDVVYFPLRAQLGALWRDRTRAYEVDIFATWHIAGEQRFSATGDAADEETGTAVADPFGSDATKSDAALYAAIGAEATVYFGNFKNKGGGKDDDKGGGKGGGKKKKN